MVIFGNDWDKIMAGEFDKEYYLKLRSFLKSEYRTKTIYPNMFDIFNAQKFTPYSEVKAVIIGQDPYHGKGQAHGLCFSVQDGIPQPPSLQNIFKELNSDLGIDIPASGNLTKWAMRGVLLLNSTLTVREALPGSHKGYGWEIYTDNVIRKLNEHEAPIVFFLWGNYAKEKKNLITNPKHLVLTAAHPSPLSAYNGFIGCRHFSKCNDFLKINKLIPIDWSL